MEVLKQTQADPVQVTQISYLGSDVVVQTLYETRDDSYSGQRDSAHFILMEELPDCIAAHVRYLQRTEAPECTTNDT